MSNKILVTGAGGQLGSELRDASTSFPGYEFIFVTKNDLAIQDEEAVDRYFKTHLPAFCINCAAYTAVDKAETERDTAFLINGEATGILAAACERTGSKFIHISTDYIFNGTGTRPYTEEDKVDPVNIYGASKLKGEELAIKYAGSVIVIRTSWVYSVYGNNFVKTMMRLMRERESIQVVDDQLGSPTYAADLAETILSIIKSGKWESGIYHYSNEGIITWFQFALAIKEIIGSNCKISPVPASGYSTPAKRPAYSGLNKKKIETNYSVVLKDWRQSLEKCIKRMI